MGEEASTLPSKVHRVEGSALFEVDSSEELRLDRPLELDSERPVLVLLFIWMFDCPPIDVSFLEAVTLTRGLKGILPCCKLSKTNVSKKERLQSLSSMSSTPSASKASSTSGLHCLATKPTTAATSLALRLTCSTY